MRKISEFLRSIKLTYVINNILNASKLAHNRALYRQYGVKKSIFSSISHADFKELPIESPWLDAPDGMERIRNSADFKTFSPEIQEQITNWIEYGYLILRGYFDPAKVKAINEEVDRLIAERSANVHYSGRILFAYRQSALLKEVVDDPELNRLMSFLLGKKVETFQSLNFIKGSQQKAHSDSIHMTTHPLGYLTAIWLALEHVGEHNGPLFYYPGSHKLPYVLNDDFDHGGTRFQVGPHANARYEAKIEQWIEEHQLEKAHFHAEPGDLLIWHANLLHGGEPILREGSTRKSMVIHYFAREVICYHELTQRPALLPLSEEV